jgi:7-cyano-7-deazaguanine synthase in queuosine biosynthesis
MKEGKVLLFSGGIDSLIAWFYLGKPKTIYCKLGHKYQEKELECIKSLQEAIPDLHVELIDSLNLGQYEEGEKAFIKNRNLLLATIASNYGNEIYLGGNMVDTFGDNSKEAYEIFGVVLSHINNQNIIVDSPFWEMTKADMVQWYLDNDYNKDYLKISVSCYSKDITKQCGECHSCFRKWIALENAGIECLDWFDKDIKKSKYVKEYNHRILCKERIEKVDNEIILVFEKYGLLE